ncbi:SDR family oxidoreductase [Desertibacillus haloalkaliphilus]|uniref:SDR family oxidoreductase n=1 Tax=Desertibacillus haloalkaliphilus TaxID=1328930 RepID=UPI001C2806DC|nr:SDR family oxidoreductase [Desertibacillus haloalkaliphilus]MBU8905176.1 SDR family oxidoreductase [Desertibacillus haloalkaliphilus]
MRHALITAGSKGLGKKVTEKLLTEGYSITINYRSDIDAVERLKKEWEHELGRIQFVQGDVTKKEDLKALVEQAYERFGRIDVLVNNAGPYIFERKKLIDYTEEEWYEMIEGNLSAVFHLLKQVIPIMRKQQYGRIITYGFQGADHAPAWIYRSAYGAAKVGLVSLMKTVSIEEAEHGITVNMVSPGNIIGDMKEASIAEARRVDDNETPIGRPGTGEDIARSVAFLCAEDADMLTGTVMEVTGGVDVLHRHRS